MELPDDDSDPGDSRPATTRYGNAGELTARFFCAESAMLVAGEDMTHAPQTKTRRERALELFRQQFNCSQAIFAAYRDPSQLDEATALRLATVMGAGVACTGKGLCGAVSGALLALSLEHGRGDLESVDAKLKTYALARDFMERFAAEHGSYLCRELLGVDIGTPEGMQAAQRADLFAKRCLLLVESAAKILDEMA